MRTLVIGCGNLLRGDDAAGPVLVRRMWEIGLPADMRCADGGTSGMDVVFQMRGADELILVDACRSGSEPGTLFAVPGGEMENLPPLRGINLHAFRWDHAIAFGRWLLKHDYPQRVTAYLIEGARFEAGAGLSPEVDRAVSRLAARLCAECWSRTGVASQEAGSDGNRALVLDAVRCHQKALQTGITRESDPEISGRLQSDPGLTRADSGADRVMIRTRG